VRKAQDERAGDSSDGNTAAACGAGETRYTAIRLGYAKNGSAVTFVHDESWCWDQGCPTDYAITWAREFRYDAARARYMNRKLDPAGLLLNPPVYTALSTTWSDYDGDEPYGDFTVSTANPPVVSNTDAYQPGLWRKVGGVADYLHSDILGTLRQTTNTSGGAGASRVFTAFGERLPGTGTDRFGYVGAWGYQSTPIPESLTPDPFPYLHIGARYYDPSSGRFLQRDPIGILGGNNVYQYADARPSRIVDPYGLWTWGGAVQGAIGGALTGAKLPGVGGVAGAIGGAIVCGIAGGLEAKDRQRIADEAKQALDDYIDRNVPKPPQAPRPPASKPGDSFSRPPGAG